MRGQLRSLVVVALMGSAFAGLQPAAPAVALPPAGPGVPIWATDWMKAGSGDTNYDPGRTLALRQARKFDVILAHASTYDDYVAGMMAANPNLRLFAYVQGMFSPQRNLPRSWYARNRSGAKITSKEFGTYLMNPESPGWRTAVLGVCKDRQAASHYHGCFLDSLGPTGVNPASVSSMPIDPATGKVYTRRHWLDATEALARKVESAVAPRPLLANGLVDGSGYANPEGRTERLLDGCTGGMMEAFMRAAPSKSSYYKSEAAWKADVDSLADAASRSQGSIVFAVTKVWTTATSSQISAWHRYALASFLLGYKPGHAYFSFRADRNFTTPSSWWDVNIGTPVGGYVRQNGVYVRMFTNGEVVVNPTTSSHSVPLSGRFVDLSGTTRSSSLSVAPHTGTILRQL
jgi:hypothetical protein